MPTILKKTKVDPNEFSQVISLSLAELDKTLDEAGKPKREIVITCLQEGPGNVVDNRWYERSAIENVEKKIYARRKLFCDHLTTEQQKTTGDQMRNWVASVMKTWLVGEEGGKLSRKVRLKIHEDWLWRRCEDAPGEIALSIEGKGAGHEGIREGKTYMCVEDIPYLSAFKFVPYPGNAAMGADLVEGQPTETQEEAMDLQKLTLEMLREARPDLVTEMERVCREKAEADAAKKVKDAEAKTQVAEESAKTALKTADGLKTAISESAAKIVTLTEQNTALAKTKEGDTAVLAEQIRSEVKDSLTEQGKVLEALREENQGLKQRLDEKEVQERLQRKDAMIERMLSESGLPDEAKTQVFRDDLRRLSERKAADGAVITVEAQVKERIEDRKKLCKGGAAVVTEAGDQQSVKVSPQNPVEEQVVIDETFRRKYSREYGMSLTPETVLVEYRKRQTADKK